MGAASRFARRLGANLARGARGAFAGRALPRRDAPAWLVLRLGPGLDDLPPARMPWAPSGGTGLLAALRALDAAARDPWVAGVLLRVRGSLGGYSRALSLRRAVDGVRASGRPVVAWAESLDAPACLVASGATRLWLPPTGSLHLVGLRLEGVYLRGLLDRLELRPEVVRVGSHKSAGDRLARASMSPEEREQLEALADDLYAELVAAIARGRGLGEDAVRERIDRGPWLGRAAVEHGLADACLYPDEVEAELAALAPATRRPREARVAVRSVDARLYHALRAGDPGWRPLLRELPRIAVVVARGAIHRGAGPRGIASERLGAALEALRREESVRGVVLRVESPGGDALASDLVWRAVHLLAAEKPVAVSMGDVAASGGYYLAAAAHAIFAEAATLTGSIGVVGGRLDAEGLLRRLGIAREAIERGANAGLLSGSTGFRSGERAAVQGAMETLYATFVERVAEGRKLAPEAVAAAAQGRVWSGARARAQGLVDELGGPLEALRWVRERAGLAPAERVAIEHHPRTSPLPALRALRRLAADLATR